MKPDSTSYENILEVENWGSQLSTFYKIMSPVQITDGLHRIWLRNRKG